MREVLNSYPTCRTKWECHESKLGEKIDSGWNLVGHFGRIWGWILVKSNKKACLQNKVQPKRQWKTDILERIGLILWMNMFLSKVYFNCHVIFGDLGRILFMKHSKSDIGFKILISYAPPSDTDFKSPVKFWICHCFQSVEYIENYFLIGIDSGLKCTSVHFI